MFDFFSLVIAIVALIFARKAMNQVATLRARLEAIEAMPAVVFCWILVQNGCSVFGLAVWFG